MKLCMRNLHIIWKISTEKNSGNSTKKVSKFFSDFFHSPFSRILHIMKETRLWKLYTFVPKCITRPSRYLDISALHVGMRLSQSSNYFRPSACHTNQAAFVSFNEAASMHQMPGISTQMTLLICSYISSK